MTEAKGRRRSPMSAGAAALCLGLEVLALFAVLQVWREAPELEFDSPTYLVVKQWSLLDARVWTGIRTVGYPLLLKAVTAVNAAGDALPAVQFLIYCGAVLVFFYGLKAYGFRNSTALAAASAVLWYDPVLIGQYRLVMTDFVALALAIATVGWLLMTAAPGRRLAAWVGLAACLFAAIQVRPAYLFLAPLAPVLGVALRRLRSGAREAAPSSAYAAGATLACGGPLLAFCGFRWLAFGHFGLVAFGGVNVIGIAGQLLNERHLALLTEDIRPLAAEIVATRPTVTRPEWRMTEAWRSPVADGDVSRALLTKQYGLMIWGVAMPAATRLYGDDTLRANAGLGDLSRQILAQEPRLYAVWVLKSLRWALTEVFLSRTVLALAAGVVLALGAGLLRHRRQAPGTPLRLALPAADVPVLLAVLTVAVAFFAAKAGLVALVEPESLRYVYPAAVFVPAALAAALEMVVRALRAAGGDAAF